MKPRGNGVQKPLMRIFPRETLGALSVFHVRRCRHATVLLDRPVEVPTRYGHFLDVLRAIASTAYGREPVREPLNSAAVSPILNIVSRIDELGTG